MYLKYPKYGCKARNVSNKRSFSSHGENVFWEGSVVYQFDLNNHIYLDVFGENEMRKNDFCKMSLYDILHCFQHKCRVFIQKKKSVWLL